MALRDQPYFPLYVQDYLTDEKLNMCSWKTQGIYIKILCIMHKQQEYGCILLKQNFKQIYKQNVGTCLIFADALIKNLPCQREDMVAALEELVENDVLKIEGNKLYQKRMVKDNEISKARSQAGKKGGRNSILLKQNFKQIYKQNTEDENEYKNEDEIINNINNVKENEIISFVLEYPLKMVKEYMLNDIKQLEILCMNNSLDKIKLLNFLDLFFKKLENEGEIKKSIKESRTHFARWLNIELKKESQSKPLQSEREKRMEGVRQLKADSAAILEHLNIKLS